MQKGKKFKIGVVLLVIGGLGLLGTFADFDAVAFFGCIALIAGGVALILIDKKSAENGKSDVVPVPTAPVKTEPKKEEVPEGQMNYDMLLSVEDDAALLYKREENLCIMDNGFDYVRGHGGEKITFKQEPENEYDSKAVAVYFEDHKLGYVYRGTTQDMINDYIKKGWPIIAHLNKYSLETKKATYKIGFYKPLELFDNKDFSVVSINKDFMLDQEIGDEFAVEEEGESYVLYELPYYNEVGKLPKNAASFIGDIKDYKNVVAILTEFNGEDYVIEHESGDGMKLKAVVTIYLVK